MQITNRTIDGKHIAVVCSKAPVLQDAQSALDLIATVKHDTGADAMVVFKDAVVEDFFMLRTGVAGELLQKFVNYRMKLAIVGDFSGYTSNSLADFIRESNRGQDVFFVETEEEAVRLLANALV